jgi:protein-disulfide isomerase
MRYILTQGTVVFMLLAVVLSPLRAEKLSEDKRLDAILDELRQIRILLQQSPTAQPQKQTDNAITKPKSVTIDVRRAPFLGSESAALAIVAFTDYECSFCQRFHRDTFSELKKSYIDTGKVRFYSMDFPLSSHQNAMTAAYAGRCADEQGQFWAIHNRMQKSQRPPDLNTVLVYAEELHLKVEPFRKCVESGRHEQSVREGVEAAMRIGILGTPTFVVGRITSAGVEGELVLGALPFEIFETKLMNLSD